MAGKLGKHLGVVEDPRTLQLHNYLLGAPKPPGSADNEAKLDFSGAMFGNDQFGDCTCAAAGHAEITWNRQPSAATRAACLDLYKRTGVGDTGRYMIDVLNEWRKNGLNGRRIRAFLKLNPSRLEQLVKVGVWQLDGVYLGLRIPQNLNLNAAHWTVPSNPGSIIGGHCVFAPKYTSANLHFVTWAEHKSMTYHFLGEFCDEAYAVVSIDQATQEHLDIARLDADLAALH
jgi:hypothetical protein